MFFAIRFSSFLLFFVLLHHIMCIRLFLTCLFLFQTTVIWSQEEDWGEIIPPESREYRLKLQRYRYKDPVLDNGELIYHYLLPEITIYPPLVFKNEKQRRAYNKLVANVKRVLPIAQKVNDIILETYGVLEQLPDKKSKEEHIKALEKEIKKVYTPEMKKLTYSQGKLLIKLVDRECNQSSYEIVKAFFGPAKATFYQIFAWTFRASLKKEYLPETDDKLIERVVRQVETGQI